MTAITPKARKLLNFLRAQLRATGICPTFEEMGNHIGTTSKASVARVVDELYFAGRILRHGTAYQAIEVLPDEDYHAFDCDCDRCASARYQSWLAIVNGLVHDAPAALRVIPANNFRRLTREDRLDILCPQPSPSTRKVASASAGILSHHRGG